MMKIYTDPPNDCMTINPRKTESYYLSIKVVYLIRFGKSMLKAINRHISVFLHLCKTREVSQSKKQQNSSNIFRVISTVCRMGSWDKFCLLMWKNWRLQLRKPISFAVEVGIPLLIVAVLLFLRYEIELRVIPEETSIGFPLGKRFLNSDVAYFPNNNQLVNKIMEKYSSNLIGFAKAAEFETYIKMNFNDSINYFSHGIQFDEDMPNGKLPAIINVRLRFSNEWNDWHTESLDSGFQFNHRQYLGSEYDDREFDEAMYRLTSIISELSGVHLPPLEIRKFPYPSYEVDDLLTYLGNFFFFGFMFVAAFLYSCSNMVKSITLEKEKQLKESMKIMGLPTWLHWTAWFIQMFIPLFIVVVVMSVAMKLQLGNRQILEHSDGSLLFIFFLLYSIEVITFSFALSVFFNKANRAASLSGLIWFLGMVPYIIIRCSNYKQISKFLKYFTSLLAPSAISYGFDVISIYEMRHIGAKWSNVFDPIQENGMCLGEIMICMFFSIFIYLSIALYVEQIYPGEFGVPQKWYFPFTRTFWFGEKISMSDGRQSTIKGEYFEEEPMHLKPGIIINNLYKTFGANDAVKGVSMTLYEDQITVLLGHNGAGKTTTMSMLTGMFTPSKGTATINGYDIRTQIMKVRDSMGLCPQHNVLFDDLTVREHLIFFSKLKGCKGPEVEADVKKFLKLLSLEDKADAKSTELSGGMKRKLSVGIALCGNSKVIMLDEPTAGMDPTARRFIWEFLQQQKKGRTILLTTHFMDEADLLGDRIAIMSGGELKCFGSSFFLKKKYGAGYHLIIDQLSTCAPNVITRLLGQYIPGIQIESNAGSELTYLLPEKYSSTFPKLLSELEENTRNLGIRSIGISLTDLEEVFMKVGTNETGKMITKENDHHRVEGYTNVTMSTKFLETGTSLYKNQIKAIFLKKYLITIRSWMSEVVKTLLPVIYITLLVYSASSSNSEPSHPSREFTLADYNNPKTFVEKTSDNIKYIDLLKGQKQDYLKVDNVTRAILDKINEDPSSVKFTYMIGASFTEGITAWYSTDGYHTLPLSLQTLMNSYTKEKFQMNFINYPIPKELSDQDKALNEISSSSNSLTGITVSAAFIGCFYILFIIKERMCRAKHLQFVSGVNVLIFWFISFIADFITLLLPLAAIIITFAILQPTGFTTFKSLSYLALVLFDFGISLLPFIYVFGFLFTVPATGFARMYFISFGAGFPAYFVILILKTIGSNYSYSKWILRFLPHYVLAEGIAKLLNMSSLNGVDTSDNSSMITFDNDGLAVGMVISYLITAFYFCIIFLVDFKILSNFRSKHYPENVIPTPPSFVDEDVKHENDLVNHTPLSQLLNQNALVLKELTKKFKHLTAVNGLNLTIKRSECFGLLGVNGAGKTTTFKMMTGDERISCGDGWIEGFSIKSQMKEVQRCIGYCPQFDALIDDLTVRETLKIFSLIRGIPSEDCDLTAERLAKDFDFSQHLDKQFKQLSGGNKRKLSTAVALIGDSPIIFLDEPTTGMDPGTKRHLWNRLSSIREEGKSIILTSHSMEECEALCTRLAIMVNGNFQCLGSIQHLKSRFSEGFSVTLKIKKTKNSSGIDHRETTHIENFMLEHFRGCELREKHQELLNYYIKDKTVKWSTLFSILEEAKKELDIEDYSIGQASLEQVFLTFTKNQKSDEPIKTKRRGCCGLCCC